MIWIFGAGMVAGFLAFPVTWMVGEVGHDLFCSWRKGL